MSKIRQQRTADQIHRLLSELVRRELSDPRLQAITVTQVSIDRELEHADIYVNALADEARQDEVMAGLTKASGFLRRELSQRMNVRSVPQLHFHWDPRLAHAEEVSAILDSLDIPSIDDSDAEE